MTDGNRAVMKFSIVNRPDGLGAKVVMCTDGRWLGSVDDLVECDPIL